MTHSVEKIDTSTAAKTGTVPTMIVAIEQHFPTEQRIIDDSLAVKILPGGYQFMVKLMGLPFLRDWMVKVTEKQVEGIWSGMLCRKRYIDDKVVTAVTEEKSVSAIVNLGAGYDTRVYRLPDLAKILVWEVDLPVNIEAKRVKLQKALGQIPSHVTLVPINFMEEELGSALAEQGYGSDHPTFFIWEAVSQYLTESAVRQTFDFLAQAPAGSQLAFTYVLKDFVEGKNLYGSDKFYQQWVVKDKAWHFGFDPAEVANFLAEYGWRLIEDLSYKALGEKYMKPSGRNLPATVIERMVYAEKQ